MLLSGFAGIFPAQFTGWPTKAFKKVSGANYKYFVVKTVKLISDDTRYNWSGPSWALLSMPLRILPFFSA